MLDDCNSGDEREGFFQYSDDVISEHHNQFSLSHNSGTTPSGGGTPSAAGGGSKSPTANINSLLRSKNKCKSKSLPYPSLNISTTPAAVGGPISNSGFSANSNMNFPTTESTDDDALDDRSKALKKKNKLFRNFSKYGGKDSGSSSGVSPGGGKDAGKKKEKLFHRRKASKNEESLNLSGIFGIILSIVTDKTRLSDGIPLAQLVRDCIDAVERKGLTVNGIYSRGNDAPRERIDYLKDQYEHFRIKPGSLVTCDVNEASTLLKVFLYEVPEPLFQPSALANLDLSSCDEKINLNSLTKFLNKQQNENRVLFLWLISHFRNVLSKSRENGVKCSDLVQLLSSILKLHSTQFLSIVLQSQYYFSPSISNSLLVHNLKYPDALFGSRCSVDDVAVADSTATSAANDNPALLCDSAPAPPSSSLPSTQQNQSIMGGAKLNNALGVSPPDSPQSLRKDLQLYEVLLNNLHLKMEDNSLTDKKVVEEELWEVQRVVTSYKRKLRGLKSSTNVSNVGVDDKDGASSSSTQTSTSKVSNSSSNTNIVVTTAEKDPSSNSTTVKATSQSEVSTAAVPRSEVNKTKTATSPDTNESSGGNGDQPTPESVRTEKGVVTVANQSKSFQVATEDVEVWRSFLLAAESDMNDQLAMEVFKMKKLISSLEHHRNHLMSQLIQQTGTANVQFVPKDVDTLSSQGKQDQLSLLQEDTEAIYRKMVEEVELVCKKQADVKLLQFKLLQLQQQQQSTPSSQ